MSRLYRSLQQASDNQNIPYPDSNPLTKTGEKILRSMRKQYGSKKGEEVFYASINAKKSGSRKWHKK